MIQPVIYRDENGSRKKPQETPQDEKMHGPGSNVSPENPSA
jgi:hypothetical protein